MAKKSSRVPLYELMSRQNGAAPSEARPVGDDRGVDLPRPIVSHDANHWLSPGRTITLPVGYALLGGALVVVALIGAFVLGYRRGDADRQAAFDRELLAQSHAAEESSSTQDPLVSSGRGGSAGAGAQAAGGAGDSAPRRDPASWGPIDSDPRVPGKSYFVLMETRQQGALQLADFCRGEGLEAYIVPSNNTGLYRVIVLPLLDTSDSSDPLVARVRAQIDEVGRRWQASGRGRSDLSDAYKDD